jgi:hypothetical protein
VVAAAALILQAMEGRVDLDRTENARTPLECIRLAREALGDSEFDRIGRPMMSLPFGLTTTPLIGHSRFNHALVL